MAKITDLFFLHPPPPPPPPRLYIYFCALSFCFANGFVYIYICALSFGFANRFDLYKSYSLLLSCSSTSVENLQQLNSKAPVSSGIRAHSKPKHRPPTSVPLSREGILFISYRLIVSAWSMVGAFIVHRKTYRCEILAKSCVVVWKLGGVGVGLAEGWFRCCRWPL